MPIPENNHNLILASAYMGIRSWNHSGPRGSRSGQWRVGLVAYLSAAAYCRMDGRRPRQLQGCGQVFLTGWTAGCSRLNEGAPPPRSTPADRWRTGRRHSTVARRRECPLLGRRSAAPSAAAAFSDGGIGEKKGSHPSRFTVYPLIPTKLATLYPVKLGI